MKVHVEIYPIESKEQWLELKKDDLSSTEISALFDANPYISLYELWHHKKNRTIVTIDENERMFMGDLLEPVIADATAKKYGWIIQPKKVYMRIPMWRLGCSFDFRIVKHHELEGEGTLEIKNVDSMIYHKKWETEEAPAHIEFQGQQQLMFNPTYLVIGMLVGGNRLKDITRTPTEKYIKAIITESQKFWESIDNGIAPEPDLERDSKFITDMYSYAEPGKTGDAQNWPELEVLAHKYREYGQIGAQAEKDRKAIKAQILMMIGDFEKVAGRGYKISSGMISEKFVQAHVKSGYRDFRINWSDKKKEP